MRVEDLYGESSPQPTKRTDTPRKTEQEPLEQEEAKKGAWKFAIFTLITVFMASVIKGVCISPSGTKRVY